MARNRWPAFAKASVGRQAVSIAVFMLLCPMVAWADVSLPLVTVASEQGGGQTYSISLQILAAMTAMTFLPGILLAMSGFTRIIIVLSILRQALGLAQTPSNPILVGLALFITFFVMSPVLTEMNTEAVQPYLQQTLSFSDALSKAEVPLRKFMTRHTRENDLMLFHHLGQKEETQAEEDINIETISMSKLIPAFVMSELKTAFQVGFMIFIPFVVIDLVVASVLMAMGMMMLSPLIISLPFKLMLFVLVDGWALVVGTLASSFLR